MSDKPQLRAVEPMTRIAAPASREEIPKEPEAEVMTQHLYALHRYRWSIALLAVGCAALGLLLALFQTPVYQAKTSLEILAVNDDFLNGKESSPIVNDGWMDSSELQTQVQLVTNPALFDDVTAKLEQAGPFRPSQPLLRIAGVRGLFGKSARSASDQRARLIKDALDSVKARVRSRTRLIDISVDSSDPRLAADATNVLAQQFIDQSIEARWQLGRTTSNRLAKELADVRVRLQRSADDLQAYARRSGLIFTDQDASFSDSKLQQVQQELSAATGDRIEKQSRYELAQTSSPDSLPDVLNDPGLRETATKLTDLKRQAADLSAVYKSGFSKLVRLQAEEQVLQNAFDRDRAVILSKIKDEYVTASRREELLQATYTEQAGTVSRDKEKSVQYGLLKSEVDGNRRLYDSLLQELQQASVNTAMRSTNARVIAPAKIPLAPLSPSAKKNCVLGLLFGLSVGSALAILKEKYNRTLRDPGEIRYWTSLPELGMIPKLSIARNMASGEPVRISAHAGGDLADGAFARVESGKKKDREARAELGFTLGEAFRGILTSILFSGNNGSHPKFLVVTSANPSEGKTTTVRNLAIAMATIGKRVLLIDADLRRPRLHTLLNIANTRGLADYLQPEGTQADSLESLVQTTDIPNLYLLSSGSNLLRSDNLLHSPRLLHLTTEAKTKYDMVLMDTPPIQVASTRLLGRLADAVIVVTRADKTTRDQLLAVQQQLREDGTNVLGTVLNYWNPRNSKASYYKRYLGADYAYRIEG